MVGTARTHRRVDNEPAAMVEWRQHQQQWHNDEQQQRAKEKKKKLQNLQNETESNLKLFSRCIEIESNERSDKKK